MAEVSCETCGATLRVEVARGKAVACTSCGRMVRVVEDDVPEVPAPVRAAARHRELDLPAPARGAGRVRATERDMDLPAPVVVMPALRGVGPASAKRDGAEQARPASASEDSAAGLLVPKGFFDDLPAPSRPANALDAPLVRDAAGESDYLDLGVLDELPGSAVDEAPVLELDAPLPGSAVDEAPVLELDAPVSAPARPGAGAAPPAQPLARLGRQLPRRAAPAAEPLDFLHISPPGPGRSRPARRPARPLPSPGARSVDLVVQEVQAPWQQPAIARNVAEAPQRPRRQPRIIAAALLVAVAGAAGAGVYGYVRWSDAQARRAGLHDALAAARSHMASDHAGHWARAARAAEQALAHARDHAEALGLAAQGYHAAFLDEGTSVAAQELRLGAGHIRVINEKALRGPEIDKAQALRAVVDDRPLRAVELLRGVLEAGPDADALLYLGWAQAAAGKHEQAARAFLDAQAAAPGRQLAALHGLGQAQLALGQRAEARESFARILALEAGHVAALVGAAQAAEVANAREREELVLAVLQRDGLDRANRRAVSLAWSLAGALALGAGRLDDARARFDHALEASPGNLDARLGLARVALGQDRLEDARAQVEAVLEARSEHLDAALLAVEIAARAGQLDVAEAAVGALLERVSALSERDRARVLYWRGRVLEARGDALDEALAAYQQARELAESDDVRPAVAVAELLSRLGRQDEARDALGPVRERAATDAALAAVLGQVHASLDAHGEAEVWLRQALELAPDDADARFRLGQVLRAQGRADEALAAVAAAFAASGMRAEIGVELARMHEARGRDDDARAIYDQLLGAEARSVALLAQAGMFFVRAGEPERAGDIGERLLREQSASAPGMYLVGERLYARGDVSGALQRFRAAVRAEADARYLEAQGRASERLGSHDEALRAYVQAGELDARSLAPLLGEARVRIALRDWARALGVLARARDVQPESAEVHHLIGVCQQQQGELAVAAASFERALRQDRRRAETLYRLGQVYFDLGKQRQAADALAAATRLAGGSEPWLSRAYLGLGYAQRSRGNHREAIAAWQEFLARSPGGAEVDEVRRLLPGLKAR